MNEHEFFDWKEDRMEAIRKLKECEDETLYWHCPNCGSHEPVEPTGDGVEYEMGDSDQCAECYSPSYVVTIRQAAAIEQAKALGIKVDISSILEAPKEADNEK